jgi:hypothetical protein
VILGVNSSKLLPSPRRNVDLVHSRQPNSSRSS